MYLKFEVLKVLNLFHSVISLTSFKTLNVMNQVMMVITSIISIYYRLHYSKVLSKRTFLFAKQ